MKHIKNFLICQLGAILISIVFTIGGFIMSGKLSMYVFRAAYGIGFIFAVSLSIMAWVYDDDLLDEICK